LCWPVTSVHVRARADPATADKPVAVSKKQIRNARLHMRLNSKTNEVSEIPLAYYGGAYKGK